MSNSFLVPSLKLTAIAPENRPKPKRIPSYSNHPFSGGKFAVRFRQSTSQQLPLWTTSSHRYITKNLSSHHFKRKLRVFFGGVRQAMPYVVYVYVYQIYCHIIIRVKKVIKGMPTLIAHLLFWFHHQIATEL